MATIRFSALVRGVRLAALLNSSSYDEIDSFFAGRFARWDSLGAFVLSVALIGILMDNKLDCKKYLS